MAEFSPFIAAVGEDGMKRLRRAAVVDRFGEAGFYGMTVGQFTDVLTGNNRPLLDSGGRTLFDVLRVEEFSKFIDVLSEKLNAMKMPKTAETVRLSSGIMPSDFTESIYVFCRSYFGLKSYKDADRLMLSEYMLARKDDFNHTVVDRNITNSMKGPKK